MDFTHLVESARRNGIERFAVGAIVHRDGEILLLRRRTDDTSYPGAEDLPSGGVDPGESLLEGLARELAEEIGMKPGVLGLEPGPFGPNPGPLALEPFVTWFDYDSRRGTRKRQFTFALPYDGTAVVLSEEHTGYRWAPAEDYAASDLTPQVKLAVRDWLAL